MVWLLPFTILFLVTFTFWNRLKTPSYIFKTYHSLLYSFVPLSVISAGHIIQMSRNMQEAWTFLCIDVFIDFRQIVIIRQMFLYWLIMTIRASCGACERSRYRRYILRFLLHLISYWYAFVQVLTHEPAVVGNSKMKKKSSHGLGHDHDT